MKDWLPFFLKRWSTCKNKKETCLLRLAILRDLFNFIHAEKSRAIVRSEKSNLENLNFLSDRVSTAKCAANLDFSLTDLLNGKFLLDKKKLITKKEIDFVLSPIPDIFISKIAREDRSWEKSILIHALKLKWSLYSLDSWINIQSVEKWHRKLEKNLPPGGVVLFAESAPQDSKSQVHHTQLWHGKWYCVLKSKNFSKQFIKSLLGGTAKKPSPPRWEPILKGQK